MTYIPSHATKPPNIFNDFSFILPSEEISQKGKKMKSISHEKMAHLGKSCVSMIDLMDKFYETTELSDFICYECSKSSSTTKNPILKKNNSTEITNS